MDLGFHNLKERYKRLFPKDKGVSLDELKTIEKKLKISLPQDFKEICSFFSGGKMDVFNISSDESDEYSIVARTLVYRDKIGLPLNYVALYEEYGFIYMDIQKTSDSTAPITYCSIEDASHLHERKPLHCIYHYFNCFSDFFIYLLNAEEKERAQNK